MTRQLGFAAAVAVLALGSGSIASAQQVDRSTSLNVQLAYYFDDNKGYGVEDGGFAPVSYDPEPLPAGYVQPTHKDEGRDLGSGWGGLEAQVRMTHTIRIPFLTGASPLMRENNLTVALGGALSPVSIAIDAEATITPVAFLNLYAGTMLGTGWDIGIANGMGPNDDGTGTPESTPFGGIVNRTWIGTTLQFDLGAVVPGDWTHVVALISPKLVHSGFTGAKREEAWVWQADDGENFNGFRFESTWFLGYRMPLALQTVGFLVETRQNMGYVKDLSAMDSGGWGSDHVFVSLGPVLSFAIPERGSLTALVQFRRERLYDQSDDSIFAAYYANRHAVGTYWDLRRVAFSWTTPLSFGAGTSR
jgi:hypothetical protein